MFPIERNDTKRHDTTRYDTKNGIKRHEGGAPGRCGPPYFRNPAYCMACVWTVLVPVGGGKQVAARRPGAPGGIVYHSQVRNRRNRLTLTGTR